MHGAYGTRHRGGMSNKTPPLTELQIPATVTTLFVSFLGKHKHAKWPVVKEDNHKQSQEFTCFVCKG